MEKTMVKQSTPPPQNPPPPPPAAAPAHPSPVNWNAPVTRGEFQQRIGVLEKNFSQDINTLDKDLRAEIKENSDALRADIKADMREQIRVLRVSIFWFIALAVSVGLALLRYLP